MEFIVERRAGLIKFDKEKMLKDLKEQLKQFENIKLESEEDVVDFKSKRAGLNKVKKLIDDERKRIKKEYSEPLKKFEDDVKELQFEIEKVNNEIDGQIKGVEEKQKEEKKRKIKEMFDNAKIDVKFDLVFNERWLNTTYSLSKIEVDLTTLKKQVEDDLETLKTLTSNTKKQVELEYQYKKTLDLNATIREFKEREEIVNTKVKETSSKDKSKYKLLLEFSATKEQLTKLKEFIEENNIDYKKIERESE